jgi:hypothetical protein
VTRKTKANETINKYKARLVAKWFKQQEGVCYFDTYLTMSKTTFIQMLIINVATNHLKIYQMDVKIIFFSGNLDKEVYIEQPEGFVVNR